MPVYFDEVIGAGELVSGQSFDGAEVGEGEDCLWKEEWWKRGRGVSSVACEGVVDRDADVAFPSA